MRLVGPGRCLIVYTRLMAQRAVIPKDVSEGKNNTTCNSNTPPTAGWGLNNLKKRRQMRWLDSLTLAAQRCTNWWLQLNVLTSLPFLLSHGLSTFNHILCIPKKVLLTYYLDNLIYLHGISYSVANCGLDKFFLLTLQSHPVLVEGTATWTLPFNVAMSEHLCISYPLYILWLPPLKKTFQTWTRSPAQVLTLAVSASFIKHAEETVRDDRGKSHTEKVLLPLLTDLFHLLLSDGVTPHLWHKGKITPLHKKGPIHPHRIIAC